MLLTLWRHEADESEKSLPRLRGQKINPLVLMNFPLAKWKENETLDSFSQGLFDASVIISSKLLP